MVEWVRLKLSPVWAAAVVEGVRLEYACTAAVIEGVRLKLNPVWATTVVEGVRLELSPVWAATVVGEVGPHLWQTPLLAAWVVEVV